MAVNDLMGLDDLAYLFKYDSIYGVFAGDVTHDQETLCINGRAIRYCAESEPAKIPWGRLGVEVVIESSGLFRRRAASAQHLQAGARKVLISAPSDDADVMIVPGVNENQYDRDRHQVLSMASCTINSLTPVAKVLQDRFGIISLFITTVHAYTTS